MTGSLRKQLNIMPIITIWLTKQVQCFVLLCAGGYKNRRILKFCDFKMNVVLACRGIRKLENFQRRWMREGRVHTTSWNTSCKWWTSSRLIFAISKFLLIRTLWVILLFYQWSIYNCDDDTIIHSCGFDQKNKYIVKFSPSLEHNQLKLIL